MVGIKQPPQSLASMLFSKNTDLGNMCIKRTSTGLYQQSMVKFLSVMVSNLPDKVMQKTFKKFIWKDSNSDQIKVILARSEYQARKQNFGNLAGYGYSHSEPLN
jgi:hypothetical protein